MRGQDQRRVNVGHEGAGDQHEHDAEDRGRGKRQGTTRARLLGPSCAFGIGGDGIAGWGSLGAGQDWTQQGRGLAVHDGFGSGFGGLARHGAGKQAVGEGDKRGEEGEVEARTAGSGPSMVVVVSILDG